MCKAIDEMREESREEGIEIGRKEMAIALLKEKVFTSEKIAELTKLSIEEIHQLQQQQFAQV